MAKTVQKITLSASRDIPFDKLIISQSNVRRIKAGVSIEELAEDIARRTLLQSITVRPVRDADGVETGMFEIPAGGRRYRALELLVKQKRLAKTALIPCVVREGGIAEEDSLAENVQRAPLHPLDQFRAFLMLREMGQSEETIAAAFFVSVAVVKQRLRLASVAPKLLAAYADDAMTLDQLMAFTVNGDHERQEQVFERLAGSHSKEPWFIRRMLTEGAVRAADKRAQFVGLDAYTEAGGIVMHDLFQGDDGGWLQDSGLLDRLVAEQLSAQAEQIRAEGWKWIEVAPDFPYGHTYGLRYLRGEPIAMTAEEQARRDALQAEYDELEKSYEDADEIPDEVDARLGDLVGLIAALEEQPLAFDPDEVSRAGAFVSIDGAGALRVERGYVRPEDERAIEPEPDFESRDLTEGSAHGGDQGDDDPADLEPAVLADTDDEDGLKPIPDRLMTELTAHRTLALRHALGEQPETAFLAALHAVCLKIFYRYAADSCLELDLKSVGFSAQAPGLNDSSLATELEDRHQYWVACLPKEPAELWDRLAVLDSKSRLKLFAHCVALSVNSLYEVYNRRPRALAHADRLAQAVDLDMVAAGWVPTVESYFGRVTKARILGAVREAKGEQAAERIAQLKKPDMAEKAQAMLAGSGWLPEPLRTPGGTVAWATHDADRGVGSAEHEAGVETAVLADAPAVVSSEPSEDSEAVEIEPEAIAAE